MKTFIPQDFRVPLPRLWITVLREGQYLKACAKNTCKTTYLQGVKTTDYIYKKASEACREQEALSDSFAKQMLEQCLAV